jgi:hypothetical protein
VLLVLGERPDAMAVAGGAVVVGALLGRALFGALAADGEPRLDSGAASVSHGPGSIRFRVPVGTMFRFGCGRGVPPRSGSRQDAAPTKGLRSQSER